MTLLPPVVPPPLYPKIGGASRLLRNVYRRLLRRRATREVLREACESLRGMWGGNGDERECIGTTESELYRRMECACARMAEPPAGVSPSGAFSTLRGQRSYAGERPDVAPTSTSLVSLPEEGTSAQAIVNLLGRQGEELLKGFLENEISDA